MSRKKFFYLYSIISNFCVWGYMHHLASVHDHVFFKWFAVFFLFACIAISIAAIDEIENFKDK